MCCGAEIVEAMERAELFTTEAAERAEKNYVVSAYSASSVVNHSALSHFSAPSSRGGEATHFSASGIHATMSCRFAKWSNGGMSGSRIPDASAIVLIAISASAR